MARTFLLTLHYDGGEFAGWQLQAAGRTVQGELEGVLERVTGTAVRAHAAGRTDAGVHAIGMGVSAILPDRWSAEPLHRALNALLPPDCWVESVREMRSGFHARTKAQGRRYRYVIGTDPAAASPFRRRYEWAVREAPAMAGLVAAARCILGEHSFDAFSVRSSPRAHKRCRIGVAEWTKRADGLGVTLDIAADRFLHHMVRMLVGTMVDIGLGRRDLDDMPRLLAQDAAVRTSPPAPARGLYFVSAQYGEEWFA